MELYTTKKLKKTAIGTLHSVALKINVFTRKNLTVMGSYGKE